MTLYRHEFAVCPWCEGETGQRVDHLYGDKMPSKVRSWYCDECGKPFDVLVKAPGDVEITKAEGSKQSFSRSMALLKFDGKDGPVFFVMDHNRYHNGENETDEQFQEHTRFFFEEHSCPTNWIGECVAVIQDDDPDPHGFLKFVRAVDVPQDFLSDREEWAIMFPEAFGGPTIDGELSKPQIATK